MRKQGHHGICSCQMLMMQSQERSARPNYISAGWEMDCDLHTLFGVKHVNKWVEVLEIFLEKLKLCTFST